MSKKKILPCPMCGEMMHEGSIIYHPANKCLLAHIGFKKEKKHIEKWNTRVPTQKIVERLEEENQERVDMANMTMDIYVDGQVSGLERAIDIVKEEGGMND